MLAKSSQWMLVSWRLVKNAAENLNALGALTTDTSDAICTDERDGATVS